MSKDKVTPPVVEESDAMTELKETLKAREGLYEELALKHYALYEEHAALQEKFKSIDSQRQGMTEGERKEVNAITQALEKQVSDLTLALQASDQRNSQLLQELETAQAQTPTLNNTLNAVVINELTGQVQVGDVTIDVVTLAKDISGFGVPGVLMITKVNEALTTAILPTATLIKQGRASDPVYNIKLK